MKLNLWPVTGINVYDLPEGIRAMFPYYSANEHAKPDSHRELKADEEGESTNLVASPLLPNTSKVLDFPNR